MELAQALQFSYTSVAQEIVCDTDTIADLCSTLDRLGAHTAMIICGPSILRSSDVIRRVREALGHAALACLPELPRMRLCPPLRKR
jgi:alcohol dehydrogenase class IV